MKNKTALQIFCENLEHNMSIETFSFYNLLKRDCLELEKQQIIDAYHEGFVISTSLTTKAAKGEFKTSETYYNQTYKND